MKIVSYVMLFLLLSSLSLAAKGDNIGIDPVLVEAGLEKPYEWSTWSKSIKHSWLQQRGIYPESGNNYQGKANIDEFFVWLGVERPTNWDQLTYEQKKDFVSRIQYPENYLEEIEIKDKPTPSKILLMLMSVSIAVASFLKPKKKFRIWVREGIYYALPLILLGLSLINLEREFFASMGEWAERLIIFLLFVKPLAMIFRLRILRLAVAYRRESGIASFWFFLFHAGGLIYTRNLTSLSHYTHPYLFWGAIAALGMIILTATSNDDSVVYFKRNWKKIQYIVYPTFLAVLYHSSIWQENMLKFYIIGGLFIVLKVLEWSKVSIKK